METAGNIEGEGDVGRAGMLVAGDVMQMMGMMAVFLSGACVPGMFIISLSVFFIMDSGDEKPLSAITQHNNDGAVRLEGLHRTNVSSYTHVYLLDYWFIIFFFIIDCGW